jgi:hypothetical protein
MTAVAQARWSTSAPRADLVTRTADAYASATRFTVAVAVVVVGLDLDFAYGASATLPLAIVLVPLWLPALRRHPLATLITGLAALSVVSGLALGELSSVDHEINQAGRLQAMGLLASGIAAFGLLLWARSLMPLHRIVALYGAGALTSALVNGQLSWKFNLAVPTAFLVLGLLGRRGTGALPAIAVLAIGVFAVLDDGRSLFATCLLAATLTIWQLRPRSQEREQSRWFPMMLIVGLCGTIYLFTTALATGGVLGETLKDRSTAQIDTSGSLIAGGRPEWAATRELFKLNPSGYGIGVVPNWADRMAGKTGLASINVDAGGYADNYMFGGQFELHSVAAGLWAGYGWVGVALAATIALALVRSLSFALAARQAPTSMIFACTLALWYILFGPMHSNWLDVCAALGIALAARRVTGSSRTEHAGHEDEGTSIRAAPIDACGRRGSGGGD